jgi:hypothetical protein
MVVVQPDTEPTIANVPNYSIELTKNAKGDHQWVIKVRGDELEDIFAQAIDKDRELEHIYGKKD